MHDLTILCLKEKYNKIPAQETIVENVIVKNYPFIFQVFSNFQFVASLNI